MSPQAIEALALSLPATTHSVQWGGEHVFKVGGKMFAVLGSGGGLSFKASDIAFEALIESGRARPAPYLARAKWVRFDDLTALDPDETAAWLSAAHGLVAARLTRAQKREHGLT